MKTNKWYYTLALAAGLCGQKTQAQNIGINEDGTSPDPHAILDVKSSTKGVLLPRISTTNRLAIPNTKGLLVYDSTVNSFFYNNGNGWQNLSSSGGVNRDSIWSLNGNTHLGSTNFIGTTDSSALKFRVGNIPAGSIDFFDNSFFGSGAGQADIPNLSTGDGTANTAFGFMAMKANVSGEVNAAFGVNAMVSNTSGADNTAVGFSALPDNNTGTGNTALGAAALQVNQTGFGNTAIGFTSGVNASNLNNTTALGFGATVTASNKVRIGNNGITAVESVAPYTMLSDGRFKFEVQEDVKGLDFILHLRPVTYRFDARKFDAHERKGLVQDKRALEANAKMQPAYDQAAAIRRSGFIAQEVEQAANVSGYDFSGVIKPQSGQDHYSLSYESFVVPLVKAIQEQQQLINELKKEVESLKQSKK